MILRTDVGRKSAAAALPGRRVHKSRWFRLAGRMAACWVVWASCFQPVPLTYVGKTGTPFQVRHWKSWSTTMLVREKKGSLSRKNGNVKAPGGGRSRASSSSPGGAKAAMILTRRINKALTAAELLDVLSEAVVFPDFNEFHISAAYHTLATFHQKKLLLPVCAESPVLPKLHARAEERIKSRQIDPRGSANVLWAMAVLLEAIPSTTSLLPVLMNVFPEKAPGMKAQELANCVWASAQLKDVAPEVLQVVPALIAQIPSKVPAIFRAMQKSPEERMRAAQEVQVQEQLACRYRFDIYRLGWYQGLGARLVATLRPFVQLPQEQPECYKELPCACDDETLLVDCGTWSRSGAWVIPTDTVPGVFLARLVLEDAPDAWRSDASEIAPSSKRLGEHWDYRRMPPCGETPCAAELHAYGAQRHRQKTMLRNALREPHASHIYFVIRQDARKTDILLQTIDTTWRAYNNYMAPSTYGVLPLPRHNFSIPESWQSRRAYKVSYNAPLVTRDTRAVNTLFNAEMPAIRWLERHGFDVQYWTGLDAHLQGAEISKRAKVYVSVGHDEYWSGEQRRHVERARDAGVHLHFWSGNEVYWKIRWETSPVDGMAGRTMVVYKESQESFKIDPEKKLWTGTFRDSKEFNPEGADPENALTGTIFTVNAWRHDALEVPGVYAQLRVWRHTPVATLKPTQRAVLLKGLLGHEWDEDVDNGVRPKGLIRLSETKVDNVQAIVDHGACFDSGSATHHLTLYKAASGALVFGAGTVQWAWGLDPMHDSVTGLSAR
ncbi:unnamed protein product [Durusdinium trenchii]|uniref:N,N-dimethylformamidase beta subunit-like C-terminal domain-containing protein n=1 Tax=Durusdinium trenchii TaxID=1381693 RepID=A0ABP0QDZ7_9DINO